ncbi:GNAT family N-acetyltransferase [Flavihumibacter stibioxidans]|uniref:N-acetyltransferase domain-containing protein n=1 Tax=Flavihumibacter stibioxidans TaxID=1834163 RepID=A0ABR7MA95_9BACT|nr:GNAT family protein [Flavihumibacter stibioxidans]MBC6491941.1 hypothetical protein [Flavihumibacter stibioxidans]
MGFDHFFHPSFQLKSGRVLLRNMLESDLEGFRQLTGDPNMWNWFTRRLDETGQLEAWVKEALVQQEGKLRFPITVIDLGAANHGWSGDSGESGVVAGSSSFGNISFHDKRIEIGWTWYGNDFRGTGINLHCKYLMLQYAFEVMAFERVEFKTDALNSRSRAALRKIGAREEGILRSHMLMPGNRRRDSVYFSVLKEEWPEVKHYLESRIESE